MYICQAKRRETPSRTTRGAVAASESWAKCDLCLAISVEGKDKALCARVPVNSGFTDATVQEYPS